MSTTSESTLRGWRRGLLAGLAAVVISGAGLLIAAPAQAHVTVNPSTTQGGAYATLTFKVPTESATASTTGLTVRLPVEQPFRSVSVQPVPGFTASLQKTKLPQPIKDGHGGTITEAVTSVTWKATGTGLAPGEFGQFPISVGPLPTTGDVFLPAAQSYSDGSVVNWVEQATGSAEPEHPAPKISITAAQGATSGTTPAGALSTQGPVSAEPQTAEAASATASTDAAVNGWALGVGVAGLVLAAGALAYTVLVQRQVRQLKTATAKA